MRFAKLYNSEVLQNADRVSNPVSVSIYLLYFHPSL
jgi:hypothetical protein